MKLKKEFGTLVVLLYIHHEKELDYYIDPGNNENWCKETVKENLVQMVAAITCNAFEHGKFLLDILISLALTNQIILDYWSLDPLSVEMLKQF